MKYMISWFERTQGSSMEYENAQKRILEVFRQWKAPAGFNVEVFVIRVGEWGGHLLVDCDDPGAVHRFCSTYPAFEFQARPVIPSKRRYGSSSTPSPGATGSSEPDPARGRRRARRLECRLVRQGIRPRSMT